MASESERNERLYSPSQWCGRRYPPALVVQKHIEFVTEASLRMKNIFSHKTNIQYGANKGQLLDLFEPVSQTAEKIATFVYIHGGYWQELNKDISSYCVGPLVSAGIRVVVPGYDLAPYLSLSAIVKEMEDLMKFLLEMSIKREWRSLWIGGHSAGGHLAALILSSNFSQHIAGFVLLSGVYDLQPLITTSINEALQLSRETAKKLSPLFLIENAHKEFYKGVVFLAVGEFDSPAFRDQQRRFVEALRSLKVHVVETTIRDTDHFTLVENLSNDSASLTKRIITLIKEAN